MENYYEEVINVYHKAISKLRTEMEEGMKIQLFDFNQEEWYDQDELYELPQQFYYTKYGYAILYYLYEVYMEDGVVYIKGRETEDSDEYDFRPEDINVADLAILVDMVLPLIEDEKTDWEKTQKRCSN